MFAFVSFKLTSANVSREGAFWISQLLEEVCLEGSPLGCGGLQPVLHSSWLNICYVSVSLDMPQMHDINLLFGLSPHDVHKAAGKPVHIEQPGTNDNHLAVFLTCSRAVSRFSVHVWPQLKEVLART